MPDTLSELAMESLALEMLVDAGRRDDRWKTIGNEPAWLGRAEDYVREHFRGSLRIGDVAEAVGVHPWGPTSGGSGSSGRPTASPNSSDSIAAVAYAAGSPTRRT